MTTLTDRLSYVSHGAYGLCEMCDRETPWYCDLCFQHVCALCAVRYHKHED